MERHKKTIFTRHLFIDLAKECGLNAAIFEQLGSGRDTEIVVDNDTLKMLVKLQEQFAQLEEMGDNEYRGFYIELPRPTQEEWGDCEASIADGILQCFYCRRLVFDLNFKSRFYSVELLSRNFPVSLLVRKMIRYIIIELLRILYDSID